jgi:hypothetical protein
MPDAQRFEAISQRFDVESSIKGIRELTRRHKKGVFLTCLKKAGSKYQTT